MKYLTSLTTLCLLLPLLFLILFTPKPCKHKDTYKLYAFSSDNVSNMYRPVCKDCDKHMQYSLFSGTPTDTSYIEPINEAADTESIIAGEYYTVTATVFLLDYSTPHTYLICVVKNENFTVRFTVEFREELTEAIAEGDLIVFQGKFFDDGCGFTNCELITKESG